VSRHTIELSTDDLRTIIKRLRDYVDMHPEVLSVEERHCIEEIQRQTNIHPRKLQEKNYSGRNFDGA
jgi:hypothetical protein